LIFSYDFKAFLRANGISFSIRTFANRLVILTSLGFKSGYAMLSSSARIEEEASVNTYS
jgi:hypothetical protein